MFVPTYLRNSLRNSAAVLAIIATACGASPVTPPPAAPATAPPRAETHRSPIGINLDGLDYWGTELPFLDIFRTSSPWISGHGDVWDDGRRIDMDEHGWVRSLRSGQSVHTVLFAAGLRVPTGRYTVEYAGEGEIEYREGATLIEHAPGHDVIEIDPSRGNCVLDIVGVNARNPLRDIHVRMPDANPRETFNPVFLERDRQYKVLRFMIWMLGAQPEDHTYVPNRWATRPTMADSRWSARRGPPVEVMIDLANRLHADPWFSIPHLADDDYVRRFAETVRDSLDPKLKVYIEHSNEVWNPDYPQQKYAQQRGLELGLSTDPGEAGLRYHARRTREIGRIFREVLGPDRVVRVLAMFTEMPELTEQALTWDGTDHEVDAVAVAPYFGYDVGLPENESRVERMSLDELFRELRTRWLPHAMECTDSQVEIARQHGLSVISYEGGQHLLGVGPVESNDRVNALFDAANRDPRMGRLYDRYIEEWSRITGGGLFVLLTDCGGMSEHGRWGALEYIDQPRSEAPKYDAIRKWIEGR